MTSKSKTKGNSWEREICNFLGEKLGGNFMRVPNSGAYIGAKNVHRKSKMSNTQITSAKGDIIPPDDLKKMNIEAKNYSDIGFHQIINGECKKLDTWIEQTETVADESDISFTIFKITRKGTWIVFSYDLFSNFKLDSYVLYKNYNQKKYIVTDYEKFINDNVESIKNICKS